MFRSSEIIDHTTLLLLEKLSADTALIAFHLVGGTALALQIGHRHSIDLDFFCQDAFDSQNLAGYL